MVRKPADDTSPTSSPRVPSRDDILAYIRTRTEPVSVSELARAFNIKGKDRTDLRVLLRKLSDEKMIDAGDRRKYVARGSVPKVTVLEITGLDVDGELRARPVKWPADSPPPIIFVAPQKGAGQALATGERILARLKPDEDGGYNAEVMRRLGGAPVEIIGVYERDRGQGRIRPTDRRAKYDYGVTARHTRGAEPGELVRAKVLAERTGRLRMAEIVERIGRLDSPGAIGLIALHSNDIPIAFPAAALTEAAAQRPASPKGREDLRETPLVTIDDEDARDFDDAVYAVPDDTPGNAGGYRLIVAIADVANYVRADSALDKAASQRGNSVYLPDRVVPMLPEALSNDLCSLKPHEDRAILACHMRINADGSLLEHRFSRALMRSAARLTYRIAQRAHDGDAGVLPEGFDAEILERLYAAYACLNKARKRRGTLELELPEYKVTIKDDKVSHIGTRTRLGAHQLIEEFMIAANVAAAEALEAKRAPCMYRVHPAPDPAKLEALRDFLDTFGLTLARGQVTRAGQLSDILARAAENPSASVIHEAVLRSQSQAAYGPRNFGHFGLALRSYAHFTSPIRRYADLLVHRALIGAYGLGPDGTGTEVAAAYDELGLHISDTERRASAAEREAVSRYLALYLSERTGTRMPGRITGVTRFGLFVRLDGLGADGLIPMRLLGAERFHHDEQRHCLEGASSGVIYSLGDDVEVEIADANALTGGLTLTLTGHTPLARPNGEQRQGPRKGPGKYPGQNHGKGRKSGTAAKRKKSRKKRQLGPKKGRKPKDRKQP
ncbi:MAG: ribonuclease R [Alphaproteobacteria bacterium]